MHRKNNSQLSSTQTPKKIQNQYIQTYQHIQKSFNIRSHLIDSIINSDPNNEKLLTSSNKHKIVTHCNQYSKIVGTLTNVISGSGQNNPLISHEKFWQINQNLQRQLEQMLRELKNFDTTIDNIVNEQFDKCNQIDEIEQNIRIILSKKEANHIAKAEPFFQQKQRCSSYLAQKKQQKQKIKQQKLGLIKKILNLLDKLKRHREEGLRLCLVQEKERKNEENAQLLLQRALQDFKQLQKNQGQVVNFEAQMRDLTDFIQQIQKRVQQYSNAILQLIIQQNQACQQYESIAKAKFQTQYFENSFLSMFGVQGIKRKPKKDFNNQLNTIIEKLQKFTKQNKQKQKQSNKIEQGIQTTKRTMGIFQNILRKIQTENTRKKMLLKDIQKLQVKHSQQVKALSQITDNQNEIQKMKLRKNQLNKNLDSKVNEANVMAYKSIHEQILKLQTQIKIKIKQIQNYKANLSQNARELYNQTMNLQQQYEDILSEIVPSLWVKGSDFTKEEAIQDLNLYLLKTFKRLSITD